MDGIIPGRDMLLSTTDKPLHAIIAEVARKHGLTYRDLVSHRRERRLAWPRQEAYWRCRQETTASLPEIGRAFGGRDHTTLLHGIKAYEKRLGEMNGAHQNG